MNDGEGRIGIFTLIAMLIGGLPTIAYLSWHALGETRETLIIVAMIALTVALGLGILIKAAWERRRR
jgi:cytochrome c oxidase subunit IV